MSTTAPAPATSPRPSSRVVLERAVAAMGAKRRVEVEVLESALAWAHAHTVTDEEAAAGWRSETIHRPGSAAALFGERPLPIAGDGAPLVAEFAVIELAGVLEQSHEATLALLGDVLDLAHRLPLLWALVQDLTVPVRLGREAARVSRDLDLVAAAHADRLLAWQPRRLNPHRIGVLVHEARLYADPDRAIADHDEALASRRVEVHHEQGAPGVSEVYMSLDTGDAVAFDHTVSTMSTTMKALGHPGDLGVRRSHAVGLLADPQRALDLLTVAPDPGRASGPGCGAAETGSMNPNDETVCVAEEAVYATPSPFRRPERGGVAEDRSGEVRLVLHLSDRDLLAETDPHATTDSTGPRGVARSDELGPMLLGRLQAWLLTAGDVTVQPVLDPSSASMPAVDQHDPPAPMAAAVRLRDEACVFPGCTRPSDRADIDHIVEYVPLDEGGPPGQTHPLNLAPLCRRHHRAKTFGAFTYHRRPDGAYEWTLPSGRRIVTDPPRPRPRPHPQEPRSRP
jgi:hypothetical protein